MRAILCTQCQNAGELQHLQRPEFRQAAASVRTGGTIERRITQRHQRYLALAGRVASDMFRGRTLGELLVRRAQRIEEALVMHDAEPQPVANHRNLAAALNDRAIRTVRGGAWLHSTVRNLLARA